MQKGQNKNAPKKGDKIKVQPITNVDDIKTIKKLLESKPLDLALFTDGLRDEREQGITIDVAYRYFTTPKRKFIIADTPGHVQYTVRSGCTVVDRFF